MSYTFLHSIDWGQFKDTFAITFSYETILIERIKLCFQDT